MPSAAFGVCHAISNMITTKKIVQGKKALYTYVLEVVAGLDVKTVQRVMASMVETCGDKLLRVTSHTREDGIQVKALKPTAYASMFLGGPQKRKKERTSDVPAAAAAAVAAPTPAPTPIPDSENPTPESENPVVGV